MKFYDLHDFHYENLGIPFDNHETMKIIKVHER